MYLVATFKLVYQEERVTDAHKQRLAGGVLLWTILFSALSLQAQTPPNWSVNAADFQHTMNITGTIQVDGATVENEASMLGAFVGEEVRGVGNVQFFTSLNQHLVFLTVYSNVSAGDTLTFNIFDALADAIYTSTTTVAFEADGVAGGISSPVVFSAAMGVGTAIDEQPHGFVLGGNYPNPFNPSTTIVYTIPAATSVRLALYDGLGREVRVLVDGVLTPNTYTQVVDATGLESGVYLYKLTAGSFEQARSMILLK